MTSAAPKHRVAIILVNWNGWRDSVECISSVLASQARHCADIWLVDNDSSDGSVQHIQQWCAQPAVGASYRTFDGVRHVDPAPVACRVWQADGTPAPMLPGVQVNIVRSGGNLGFAGGNNAGLLAAGLDRYTHFWLLNTDTVVADDALSHLLWRADADQRVGLVGSTLLYYAQPQQVQALGGGRLDRMALRVEHIGECSSASAPVAADLVESEMAYVVGASMLATAAFVRSVGLMCEDYFLYFEELDWAFRGSPTFKLGYAPASRVFHKVGASSTQTLGEFSLNLLYRNQLRFASRFLPDRVAAVKRALAWELIRHMAKGRWMPARLIARALADARNIASTRALRPTPP